MATCETCNDTHSMSLRGSLVPCTRCPTPCQECRINGRGAYCAKTPCACACHAIVDRPAPTPTPAPGLDLDAVERAERAMTPGPWRASDGSASAHGPGTERIGRKMVPLTVFGCAETRDRDGIVALRNAAPALIAEVRALRRHYDAAGPDHNLLALLDLYHEREQAALAKLAETKSLLRSAGDLFVEIQTTDGEDEHKAITDGAKLSAAIAAALEAL